jgi:hypothetical protein
VLLEPFMSGYELGTFGAFHLRNESNGIAIQREFKIIA